MLHEFLLVVWLAWPLEWAWVLSCVEGHLMQDWTRRSRPSRSTTLELEVFQMILPIAKTKNQPPWIVQTGLPMPGCSAKPIADSRKNTFSERQTRDLKDFLLLDEIKRRMPFGLL